MAGKYATTTTVPVEKTKAEIEGLLRKYGASSFVSGWDARTAAIQFEMADRRILITMPQPDPKDETFTHRVDGRSGRVKPVAPTQATAAWEQACRSSWRSLRLLVQAMLEAVEAEIVTFEQIFLPFVVLPDGRTVHQAVGGEVERAYAVGEPFRPMLELGSGRK